MGGKRMKMFLKAALVATAAIFPSATTAQTYVVPVGYPVSLMTRTELTTKENRAGERFNLEVAEAVVLNGNIVIPVGTPAVGEIVRSERNGHFGKRGEIVVRVLHIETPSMRIPLAGNASDKGVSGTAAMLATTLLVSPLGVLIHGTSGRIPAGSRVDAYLAGDLRFNVNDVRKETAVLQISPGQGPYARPSSR